jgi:Cof subfamily protein (haloacid dehalogenase superfamily)
MNKTDISVLAARREDAGPVKANPVAVVTDGPASSYRMVALDLDGTLLSNDHKLAEVQAEYLRSLQRRGLTVCFATGRSASSIYEHVRKLNFPLPLSIPVVCSNGARGFHCDTQLHKKEVFYNPVPKSTVESALRLSNQHGFAIQYYYEDSIYINSTKGISGKLTDLYSQLTGSRVVPVEDDFASILHQNHLPSKLLVLFDESRIDQACHIFQSELESNGEANVVLGNFDWFLEVLNPQVTKGHGLANMCSALGIPLDECIAMGDGANDLEFLEMAGLGIAMQNGKEAAKKVADATMEWTNDQHGVMKTLQRLEEQGLLQLKED